MGGIHDVQAGLVSQASLEGAKNGPPVRGPRMRCLCLVEKTVASASGQLRRHRTAELQRLAAGFLSPAGGEGDDRAQERHDGYFATHDRTSKLASDSSYNTYCAHLVAVA